MPTINQLIDRDYHTPVRKIFIKRRLVDTGTYEADWVRIDNFKNKNRVVDFGSGSQEIDHQPGDIANFEVSEYSITFDNSEGLFNVESDGNSIWNPEFTFLNRKLTKLKIETGYLDDRRPPGFIWNQFKWNDGSKWGGSIERGVENVYEGVIEKVVISESQKAVVTVVSYQFVLTKFPITDLSAIFTAPATQFATITDTVRDILNQPKITEFFPFVEAVPGEDVIIDRSLLTEGTYWEILKDLAKKSNSIISVVGDSIEFKERKPSTFIVKEFFGNGSKRPRNIFNIDQYDDEGADRVRVFWKELDGDLTAKSTDPLLLAKYLSDPEEVDLSEITTDEEKQSVLDALLAEWEKNKPTISFPTKFLINQIKPLDRITIDIPGHYVAINGGFIWNQWKWNDGSKWGQHIGAIKINPSSQYVVTRVTKNVNDWSFNVKAERIV